MHTFFALVKADSPNSVLIPPHQRLKCLKLNELKALVINCKFYAINASPETREKIL
jgi:hypothetical protein